MTTLIYWGLIGLTLAAAQDTRPATRPRSAEESPRELEGKAAETRPQAPAPPAATGSPEALALADRVLKFGGGVEGWKRVDNLVFTFAGSRRLYWDVRAGRVRIEFPHHPGQVLVYDTSAGQGTKLGGDFGDPDPDRMGQRIWINDTYWLLVALKVKDPGVRLLLDARQPEDPEAIVRLRLRFSGVGVTPENEYVLHVEKKSGKIVQWDFYKNAETEPESWRFDAYRRVGPLNLSLSRPGVGGQGSLELADVAVNVKVPANIWTAETNLLGNLK